MAHSLSAKKRVRQSEKKKVINKARKSQVKSLIKKLEVALISGNLESAKELYKSFIKKIDMVASKSTMHKKTASRKKSRLAKRLNALAAKKA